MNIKRHAIFVFAVAAASGAHADPVEAAPIFESNYYVYLSCLKATRAEVAKIDPTGLYAKVESSQSAILAAR